MASTSPAERTEFQPPSVRFRGRPATPLVMELQQSRKMQSLAPSLRKLEEDRARRDRHRGKVDSSLQRLLEAQALASIQSVTPQLSLANIAVTEDQLNRWRDIHRGKADFSLELSLEGSGRIPVTEEQQSRWHSWQDFVEIDPLSWSTAHGGAAGSESSPGATEAVVVSGGELAA